MPSGRQCPSARVAESDAGTLGAGAIASVALALGLARPGGQRSAKSNALAVAFGSEGSRGGQLGPTCHCRHGKALVAARSPLTNATRRPSAHSVHRTALRTVLPWSDRRSETGGEFPGEPFAVGVVDSSVPMAKSWSAGGVVVGPQGRVVVVSQCGNSWSLPKGHVEDGETSLQAAEREVFEETGLQEVRYRKALGTYERYRLSLDGAEGADLGRETKVITMYLFSTTSERLAPLDPKNPEARWVEPDAVSSMLTHPLDRAFFESIRGEVDACVAAMRAEMHDSDRRGSEPRSQARRDGGFRW